jgi:oligogalacturonide transport system substrate-binding protein
MKKHNKWIDFLIFGVILAMSASLLHFSGYYRSDTTIVDSYNGKGTLRFGWWGNDERHTYTLKGVDLFEQKNRDIAVDCQYSVWSGYEHRYRIFMRSGTEPDVMLINYNWLKEYSADGTGYYDLNELSDVIDFSGYISEDLNCGMVNGHLNALPTAYNAVVFYYNKEILDHFGLAVPKTWNDLAAAADILYEDGIVPLYLNEKHLFLMINAYYEQTEGKEIFDSSGNYTGGIEAAQEFLSFYKELVDRHIIRPLGENNVDDFTGGKTAGAAFWASDASRYCDSMVKQGYTMVSGEPIILSESRSTGWYLKPATMYAIRKDTEHPEEAGKLLNFLLNDPDMAQLQGLEKGVPVSQKARSALPETELQEGFSAEAGNAILNNRAMYKMMNPFLENENAIRNFREEAARYLYGKEDLKTAAVQLSGLWSDVLS